MYIASKMIRARFFCLRAVIFSEIVAPCRDIILIMASLIAYGAEFAVHFHARKSVIRSPYILWQCSWVSVISNNFVARLICVLLN